jgi:hypothetical protein
VSSVIHARALAAQVDAVRARFTAWGAAQFHDVVDAAALNGLLEPALDALDEVAVRNQTRDRLAANRITLGGQHSRVDAGHPSVDEARAELMAEVLRSSGIERAAADMAAAAASVVEMVTGGRLRYARAQILLYGADDYLGPHTDVTSGPRYNVQTALTRDCASGLRVFGAAGPRILPDWPGTLRVLGPNVWHEVLPLLPSGPAARPRRIVLSLRFEAAPGPMIPASGTAGPIAAAPLADRPPSPAGRTQPELPW